MWTKPGAPSACAPLENLKSAAVEGVGVCGWCWATACMRTLRGAPSLCALQPCASHIAKFKMLCNLCVWHVQWSIVSLYALISSAEETSK